MFGLSQTSTDKYLWSRNGRMCGNAQPTSPAETNVFPTSTCPQRKDETLSLKAWEGKEPQTHLKPSKPPSCWQAQKFWRQGFKHWHDSQSLWASEIPQILSFRWGEVCSEEQLERQDANWAEKEHWGWEWENVPKTQRRDVPEKQVQEVVGSKRITKA